VDYLGAQSCSSDRSHLQREPAIINDNHSRLESVRRHLTFSWLIGTKGRNVKASMKVSPEQEGLTRPGRGYSDIGSVQRFIERSGNTHIKTSADRITHEALRCM
jgi:hypothetical protein